MHWLVTGAALVLAGAALLAARRQTKRLERLTESYWELRFEHGQLRARVNRLDPEQPSAAPERAAQPGTTAFVPLSEMFGYATQVRSMSQGRASYTMQFFAYEPAPKSVADEVIAKVAG